MPGSKKRQAEKADNSDQPLIKLFFGNVGHVSAINVSQTGTNVRRDGNAVNDDDVVVDDGTAMNTRNNVSLTDNQNVSELQTQPQHETVTGPTYNPNVKNITSTSNSNTNTRPTSSSTVMPDLSEPVLADQDQQDYHKDGTNTDNSVNCPALNNESGLAKIFDVFKLDDQDDLSSIHNYYICIKRNCTCVSKFDNLTSSLKKEKFNHQWAFDQSLSYDTTCGMWWLVFKEKAGMYCLLCKKHDQKNPFNQSKVWNVLPSVRMKKAGIQDHIKTEMHRNAIRDEMLQRISVFHKDTEERKLTENIVLEEVFYSIYYYLIKEEISNEKLLSLLDLMELLGVDNLKYFQTRSRSTLREMF